MIEVKNLVFIRMAMRANHLCGRKSDGSAVIKTFLCEEDAALTRALTYRERRGGCGCVRVVGLLEYGGGGRGVDGAMWDFWVGWVRVYDMVATWRLGRWWEHSGGSTVVGAQ